MEECNNDSDKEQNPEQACMESHANLSDLPKNYNSQDISSKKAQMESQAISSELSEKDKNYIFKNTTHEETRMESQALHSEWPEKFKNWDFQIFKDKISSLSQSLENVSRALSEGPCSAEAIKDHKAEKIKKNPPFINRVIKDSTEIQKIYPENDYYQVVGIPNLGNTCFMNSVLQCLSSLSLFTEMVQNMDPTNEFEVHLQSMIGILTGNIKKANICEEMRKFKKSIEKHYKLYRGTQMHDQKEFLGNILSILQKNNEEVSQRFLTIVKSQYMCNKCLNNFESVNEELWIGCNRSVKNKQDAILKFIRNLASGCDALDCDNCRKQSMILVNYSIALADILVVNLGEHRDEYNYEKISYPPAIIINEQYYYELRGVCAGNSFHGTAIKRQINDPEEVWYFISDEQVKRLKNPVSNQAVLLFYEKKKMDNGFRQ